MKKLPLSEKDLSALKEFRERLVPIVGDKLLKMLLFGSKAEGRATPESDIDVLVLIKDDAAALRHQVWDLAFEVNVKHGVYISPRVIPLSTYEHPVWRITHFVKKLHEQGIAI